MKTRRLISFIILCSVLFAGAAIFTSAAQSPGTPNPAAAVRETVRSDRTLAAGLDRVYDQSPKVSTPAPKGYEPVFVEHYGRHGSRYAYTAKAYTVPLEILQAAAKAENLTEYGNSLCAQLSEFWKQGQYKVGDLTPLGWQQHSYIASTMVESFPSAFGKGSRVNACSSAAVRSIMSMTSCVSTISRKAPKAEVYAHQGVLDIQATRPNMGKNPFRYTGPEAVFPFPESQQQFFYRHFPNYMDVLGRLFVDPAAALGSRDPYDLFFNLYMLVAGMYSIPAEEQMDLTPLFTDEEFAILWETDNYERFREYLPYRTSCASIVDDMIAKADARLGTAGGASRGADLRFGHDHVVMSLLQVMDIDGFGCIPAEADDLVATFHTYCSPMAANIQLVFYAPKRCKPGDVLVKLLLNGSEARFGELQPVQGPYYSWPELRDYLNKRVALFVVR